MHWFTAEACQQPCPALTQVLHSRAVVRACQQVECAHCGYQAQLLPGLVDTAVAPEIPCQGSNQPKDAGTSSHADRVGEGNGGQAGPQA